MASTNPIIEKLEWLDEAIIWKVTDDDLIEALLDDIRGRIVHRKLAAFIGLTNDRALQQKILRALDQWYLHEPVKREELACVS